MMKLVDVHAHLEHLKFEKDLDEVVGRFVDAGGKMIISSGTSPEKNREALELSKRFNCVRASFGMYPVGNFGKDIDGELDWIEEHVNDCVAIGEIGLDFDNNSRKEDMERQKELFRKMLKFAKKIGKPVVIHCRKAEVETIEILEEMKMERVVMHCFCGDESLIKRCVENGWSFSVPPVIMRWSNFKILVEMTPLSQLLTETDSPYLSSVTSKRNEPVNVLVTLKEIARIKGLSVEEVGERIWENAGNLFFN